MVEPTLHVKNISLRKVHNFGFVSNIIETRRDQTQAPFRLSATSCSCFDLCAHVPPGVPMGSNGILSLLRIWLMIIQICE